jgi:hypothetical protein
MAEFELIHRDGRRSLLTSTPPRNWARPTSPITVRRAYAAAHVVPKPWAENVPGAPADIDWGATMQLRHHLWSWGLGVADAMDTAQRNMGLDRGATEELIRRSAAEALSCGGDLLVGVNTDHVEEHFLGAAEIIDAYSGPLEEAEALGAGVVLMASRHLARSAHTARDYERVYGTVLSRAQRPVVLHWLGTAFDPTLAGYFGSDDPAAAVEVVLRIIQEHADRVAGIKVSLLDPTVEIALRSRLPSGVSLFTGDDFNFVQLIEGDGRRHSDALLGAFTAVAPAASAALQALQRGETEHYRRILRPTEALARVLFEAPTFYYKTGIAFLAWLNGHQRGFSLVGGLHAARSLPHLSEVIRLADAAGVLEEPDLAAYRWHSLLTVHGVMT